MRPANPYMRPAPGVSKTTFCLSKSTFPNFAAEASQIGKGSAKERQSGPKGLIALIALFAHFNSANHALVTASPWKERGYRALSTTNNRSPSLFTQRPHRVAGT
jgi:hypothetical protein